MLSTHIEGVEREEMDRRMQVWAEEQGYDHRGVLVFQNSLHPREASVDVALTLSDSTVVRATGSTMITLGNSPSVT